MEVARPDAEAREPARRPGQRRRGVADVPVREDAQRGDDQRDAVRGEAASSRKWPSGTCSPRGTGVPPVPAAPNPTSRRSARAHTSHTGRRTAASTRSPSASPIRSRSTCSTDGATNAMRSSRTREQQDRDADADELRELRRLHSKTGRPLLDAGHGECWLRRAEIAAIVADALEHFDGERYRLLAWCVMPNHVHAVVQPLAGSRPAADPALVEVVHRQGGEQAARARRATFWQAEYYDHLVRDEDDLRQSDRLRVVRIRSSAGLEDWTWRGRR